MADDIWPDSGWEFFAWVLIVVLALAFFVREPSVAFELDARVLNFLEGDDGVNSSSVLFLPVSEAEYLNRQYSDLNSKDFDRVGEGAFCLDVRDDYIFVQRAGTIEASQSSVKFTTSNCLSDLDGIAHFHPPGSRAVLSGPGNSVSDEFNDKQTFLEMDVDLSCVQAGLVRESPGGTEVFRCYVKDGVVDAFSVFPEVEVFVVE